MYYLDFSLLNATNTWPVQTKAELLDLNILII